MTFFLWQWFGSRNISVKGGFFWLLLQLLRHNRARSTAKDCATIDAVCIQGQKFVFEPVGRAVWGANVCHRGPLAIESFVASVTLIWPPMGTRLSALRPIGHDVTRAHLFYKVFVSSGCRLFLAWDLGSRIWSYGMYVFSFGVHVSKIKFDGQRYMTCLFIYYLV